ncbi:YtzH-like family protein [Pseudogracilibacillus auburnensis]|uniref:YtzH-like protein n=1 Tax=Pseudogracilibacillus auburnensis TaxID=1494959 RepID=A0A2V3VGD8_9BACI|nr:YtzH-like family protein [Pseudogracilibacillus auburnensis]MBO1003286.1 YtzH-like family protein [Pseudogracilibacillus auburnensis]PXW80862.1 YtzH-like protein [Pseudogracilibacillus auburnensis]
MYLTVHNQLTLLHDLLDEQVTFKTVSMNEYRQIKKLVQTMIANKEMDGELLTVLPEIYYYGIKGEIAHSFSDHISENENNIQKWLETINRTKTNIS